MFLTFTPLPACQVRHFPSLINPCSQLRKQKAKKIERMDRLKKLVSQIQNWDQNQRFQLSVTDTVHYISQNTSTKVCIFHLK